MEIFVDYYNMICVLSHKTSTVRFRLRHYGDIAMVLLHYINQQDIEAPVYLYSQSYAYVSELADWLTSEFAGVLSFVPTVTDNVSEVGMTELYRIDNCNLCKLAESRTKIVNGSGKIGKCILLGEAPGEQEDQSGKPFVGRAGHVLSELLAKVDLSREDVYITNLCKCRPPNNRNPHLDEQEACAKHLKRELALFPDNTLIVTLGAVPLSYLLGRDVLVGRARGYFLKIMLDNKPFKLLPTYHPAFALYHPEMKKYMEDDFKLLKKTLEQ